LESSDWLEVKHIYEEGLQTRIATFETVCPPWNIWDKKYLRFSRLVMCNQSQVLGWAALSEVSNRAVYIGVAEVRIYINAQCRGMGLGHLLLSKLVRCSEERGIWTLQSSIFPENKSSIRIHQKAGFRKVGYREKIAQLDGKWRDTILMERRSSLV